VWFVYVLRCADGSLYVGETSNLEQRVVRHREGTASAYTARRRPVSLSYSECHPTRNVALKRERQLKRWTRAKKEALVAGDVERLKKL
jgi:predicted GIY-YIG superfamily endonuclease